MRLERESSYFVTLALLIMAAVYHSPLFGYASVLCLGVALAKDIVAAKVMAMHTKIEVPEDLRRSLQDMNARIATLEYGVKTRGF